jgi:ATP-dependent helicase/nuclease subunit B
MRLPSFIETLADGVPIILPTASAARALRRDFDERQRSLGRTAWQPPNILSWRQWLSHLWSSAVISGVESRLLLNAAQEHVLWLETINARPVAASLTSTDALADLAAQAWSLANAYRCTGRLRASANTLDTRSFAAWAEGFARGCERRQYLSVSALEAALAQHIEARELIPPPSTVLMGFLALTPAQQVLLDALHAAGVRLSEQPLETVATQASRYAASSEDDELRAMALKIRSRLEIDPELRIAVVLADPADAQRMDAVFRNVLAPELQNIAADTSSAPWQFADEGPLSALAVAAGALDVLQLAQSPLSIARLTGLLLSPYLGSASGRDDAAQLGDAARLNDAARFDADVIRKHSMLRPELDLDALHKLVQGTSHAPGWIKPLHQFVAKARIASPRAHGDWTAFARAMLQAAGWPGTRQLTSMEYQATEAFDALLDTLSTLDFRGLRVSWNEFLSALVRQAAVTAFTPSSTDAPVQVLPLDAVVGQSIDLLLVPRATDSHDPRERTHPFLSFALQSSLDMPGANAAGVTARARAVISQLLGSAREVLLTYTPEPPSGPQRFSPLLEELAHPVDIQLALPAGASPLRTTAAHDDLSLPPLPSAQVAGGSRLLKLQAACGFLAFSELRLHSTQPQTPISGFDAMEDGNLVHRALDKFWRQTQTQENLRHLSRMDRATRLRACIAQAIPAKLMPTSEWEKAYLDLQKERLFRILDAWLDKELERGPFTVLASEREELVAVGELTLRVRIDRIDQVPIEGREHEGQEHAGHVFVDYKTGGSAHPKAWDGERMEEPQLPLYALLSEPGELKGVAFARVRAGKDMGWQGYQSEPNIFSAKKTRDIEADIEQWRQSLSLLAHDFASGIADVNPKSFAVNCKYCVQRLLCRINPEGLLASMEADAEEAGEGEQD